MISGELAARPEAEDPHGQLDPMCHDLRQPLAAIMMLAAAASAEAGVSDTTRVRLEQITVEAEWMSSIIREVPRPAPPPRTSTSRHRPPDASDAGRGDVACQMQLPDRPVRVRANATLVRRAVANIVDNACRAAGPAARVDVGAPDRTMGDRGGRRLGSRLRAHRGRLRARARGRRESGGRSRRPDRHRTQSAGCAGSAFGCVPRPDHAARHL